MFGTHVDILYFVSSAGSTQPTASLVSTPSCVTISQPSTDTLQEQHTLGKSASNGGDS